MILTLSPTGKSLSTRCFEVWSTNTHESSVMKWHTRLERLADLLDIMILAICHTIGTFNGLYAGCRIGSGCACDVLVSS